MKDIAENGDEDPKPNYFNGDEDPKPNYFPLTASLYAPSDGGKLSGSIPLGDVVKMLEMIRVDINTYGTEANSVNDYLDFIERHYP